jgi:hypothetical protein
MLVTSSVVASVLLASIVSAIPFEFPRVRFLGSRSTAASSTAAVYFMTNEPAGNFVVSMNIGNDGKLSLAQAVATGGDGAHGITAPNSPDPLFSQGAVKASPKGKVLAVTNAGSNSVSLFSIDPLWPSNLQMIGKPISSGGEFPLSLAFNKNGTMLCSLNGGFINGVQCFSVDPKAGLQPISDTFRSLGMNQTTPPTGPEGTASHVIFSEDGKQLIASVKGTVTPPVPGFLAVWDVLANNTLSRDFARVDPAKGGLLPFSMTVIPGKNAVLATDAGVGFNIFDMSAGAVNSSKSSVVPINGQGATCWSVFSNMTGNFYLTDVKTSIVTEVNVDSALAGTIVKQYVTANNSGTIDLDVATISGNDYLYVLSANASAVDVMALSGPGQAQSIQTLDLAGPAQGARLTLNPLNLQGLTTFVSV